MPPLPALRFAHHAHWELKCSAGFQTGCRAGVHARIGYEMKEEVKQ